MKSTEPTAFSIRFEDAPVQMEADAPGAFPRDGLPEAVADERNADARELGGHAEPWHPVDRKSGEAGALTTGRNLFGLAKGPLQ